MTPELGRDDRGVWPKVTAADWCKQWRGAAAAPAETRTDGQEAVVAVIRGSEGGRMAQADVLDVIIGGHKGKKELSREAARGRLRRMVASGVLISTPDEEEDIHWITVAPGECQALTLAELQSVLAGKALPYCDVKAALRPEASEDDFTPVLFAARDAGWIDLGTVDGRDGWMLMAPEAAPAADFSVEP